MSDLISVLSAVAGSSVAEETDEYFQDTVLLLHGDGNQGATNFSNISDPVYLAFKDNSSNNFPITVNGDAYGDNFGPYALGDGNWSNFFDGSGSAGWVYTPQSSAFTFDGDFTISAWVYLTKLSTTSDLIGTTNNRVFIGAGNSGWTVNINTSGQLRFGYMSSNSWVFDSNLGITVPLNQFVHIAVVRSGSTITGYVGGVAGSSPITSSATLTSNLYGVYIGDGAGSAGNNTDGYVSNVHIQKGTAINYASVGVPSSPESITAYTSLLTCQSNRYKDNSTNSFTVTPGGGSTNVAVKVFNPFGELPDGVNGSGYFDGTGDSLSVPTGSSGALGTGDFCVSCWYNIENVSAGGGQVIGNISGATGTTEWGILDYNGTLRFQSWATLWVTGTASPRYTWNWVVVCREGTTLSMFVNGVRVGTTTTSNDFSATSNIQVAAGAGVTNFQGFVSNVRVVKGSAVYDPTQTTITVPASPLTAVSGTELLTCQYAGTVRNVGFIDSGPYDFPITRVGNTTQGTFSPFSKSDGAWANFFDGSGDYLDTPTNQISLDVTQGDFTIEAWVYRNASGAEHYICSQRGAGSGYELRINSNNTLQGFYTGGSSITSTGTVPANQWVHICWVRSSSTASLYINGTRDGTGSFSNGSSAYTAYALRIGYTTAPPAGSMNGYVSNFRLVKGSAVYDPTSTTLTVPTSPLTAVSGTSLLTCQSNRFVDNSSNAFAITAAGNPKVTPFSPFPITTAYSPSVNGGAAYFDGSGDRLTITSGVTDQFDPESGFTLECWVYVVGSSSTQYAFEVRGTTGDWNASTGIVFQLIPWHTNGLCYWQFKNGSPTSISGTRPPINTWAHLCVGYDGSTTRLWLNGASVGTSAAAYSPPTYSNVAIGSNVSATVPLNGFVGGLRFVKGVDIYGVSNTTITVPTTPFTAVSGTTLLCNFTNAGILDNTCFNALESVGGAQVDTTTKKYGTGSLDFAANDGTAYLLLPASDNTALGGDFTVEFWLNPDTVTTSYADSSLATLLDSDVATGTGTEWWAIHQINNTLQFVHNGAARLTSDAELTASVWQHCAFVRSGSTLTCYIDGVAEGSTTYSTAINGSRKLYIAKQPGASRFYKGYIDDLRITKGVARYTTTFTPPDKALPNIGV
jgi:hypothetical protein